MAVLLAALPCTPAAAQSTTKAGVQAGVQAEPTVLDRYLDGLRSLQTDFTQTVTDAQGKRVDGGGGSLLVERPGRFRWDYEPGDDAAADPGGPGAGSGSGAGSEPRGQLLVADGANLWFYDRELAQVTVKPLDAGLSSTPIMLLTGSAGALRADFSVKPAAAQDGMSWVTVRPHDPQADFSEARLGFRGDVLARMVVHNMLGQTVQLDFSHARRNASVDAAAFQFKVPPGVDLIGTPQAGAP